MGEEKEDKDLRKEVEMTEHTDSIATVCNQYNTDPDKGLTSAAAEEVSIKFVILSPSLTCLDRWLVSLLQKQGKVIRNYY